MESRGLSLLHRCVLNMAPVDLKGLLVSLTTAEINKADSHGMTACQWAARRGDSVSLALLLQYGADCDKQNSNRYRPLNAALQANDPACVRLLLDHGCEVNYVDLHGWSPLHGCCYAGFDNDIIDELLQKGLDIDRKTGSSAMTPLMYAAQENHVDVVQHLISRGANINDTDSFGQDALHIAIKNNNHKCIQRLLELEADYTTETGSLENILHYAAQWAGLESLSVLHGFDLRSINPDAKVSTTTDIQIMNVKGLTALEIAERRQDVSAEWLNMFRKLVDGIRDPRNKTPVAFDFDEGDEFHDAREHQN